MYLPEDRTELKRALEEVLRYGAKVLAEERIYGRELTVAVLGDRWLPAVETAPPERNLTTWPSTRPALAVETCAADVPPRGDAGRPVSWPCGPTGRWDWRSTPART